jgi:hypothetical protein
MDFVIATLALVVGVVIVVGAVSLLLERSKRRQTRMAATERRGATWEVGEESGRGAVADGGFKGAVTRVFVRRVTPDGAEVDRIAVADVPSAAEDWDVRMLEARSKAAQRAAILNGEP